MRVLIEHDPFIEGIRARYGRNRGFGRRVGSFARMPIKRRLWPPTGENSMWMGRPDIRIHVSADERYELFLDGVRQGRGPERGAPDTWFYESFNLDLKAGEHVLAARIWALGDLAPDAQMSSAPGFLLAAEGEWNARLSTGVAAWESKLVRGIDFHRQTGSQLRGSRFIVDGALYPWGHEMRIGRGLEAGRHAQTRHGSLDQLGFL